jgi:hemin uptake protein HemP
MSTSPNTIQRTDSAPPVHLAEHLTKGGTEARIVLREQTYTLRITRSGKLILTK